MLKYSTIRPTVPVFNKHTCSVSLWTASYSVTYKLSCPLTLLFQLSQPYISASLSSFVWNEPVLKHVFSTKSPLMVFMVQPPPESSLKNCPFHPERSVGEFKLRPLWRTDLFWTQSYPELSMCSEQSKCVFQDICVPLVFNIYKLYIIYI